jgi:hypothetical protein
MLSIQGLSIFFPVYQYFIIYRQYFLLKFEQFSRISNTTNIIELNIEDGQAKS